MQKRSHNGEGSQLTAINRVMPDNPVIVLGMHHSGTSILAETLHRHGIFMHATMAHSESQFFTALINDQIIMGGGSNWARDPIMSVDELLEKYEQVNSIIAEQCFDVCKAAGYNGYGRWGFKDPRSCVTLPLLLKVFPRARLLHIVRNEADVACSLAKSRKAGMGLRNDVDFWCALHKQHVERAREFGIRHGDYFEFTYEDFCRTPIESCRKIFSFLDVPWHGQLDKFLMTHIHSDRIDVGNQGSHASLMKSDESSGEADIDEFIREHAGDIDALKKKAMALRRDHHWHGAHRVWQSLLGLQADNYDWRLRLIEARARSGDLEGLSELVFSSDPSKQGRVELVLATAKALIERSLFQEAQQLLSQLPEPTKRHFEYLFTLGRLFHRQHQYDKAALNYANAIRAGDQHELAEKQLRLLAYFVPSAQVLLREAGKDSVPANAVLSSEVLSEAHSQRARVVIADAEGKKAVYVYSAQKTVRTDDSGWRDHWSTATLKEIVELSQPKTVAVTGRRPEWGSYRLRGQLVCNEFAWNNKGNSGSDADVTIVIKELPEGQIQSERILFDPLDCFTDFSGSPDAYWKGFVAQQEALLGRACEWIATSPSVQAIIQKYTYAKVHLCPHWPDPRVRHVNYHRLANFVYDGDSRFLSPETAFVKGLSRITGKSVDFQPFDAWTDVFAVLSVRASSTAIIAACKPQIKLANAMAAGLPCLCSDLPVVKSLLSVSPHIEAFEVSDALAELARELHLPGLLWILPVNRSFDLPGQFYKA